MNELTGVQRLNAARYKAVRLVWGVLTVPVIVSALVLYFNLSERDAALKQELLALEYRALLHHAARDLSALDSLSSLDVEQQAGESNILTALRAARTENFLSSLERLNAIPLSGSGRMLFDDWLRRIPDLRGENDLRINFEHSLRDLLQFTEYFAIDSGLGTRSSDTYRGLLDYSDELIHFESQAGRLRRLKMSVFTENSEELVKAIDDVRLGLIYQQAEALLYDKLFSGASSEEARSAWRAVRELVERAAQPSTSLNHASMQDWYLFATARLEKISDLHYLLDSLLVRKVGEARELAKFQVVLVSLGGLFLLVFLLFAIRHSKRLEYRERQLLSELEQTKRRYRVAVDSAEVGLFERPDITQDDVFWSPKLYELLGLPDSEPPTPLMSLVHPDYRSLMDDSRHKALKAKVNVQMQAPLLCGDGTYRWFSVNAVVYRDNESEIVGLSGAVISISELKEAETLADSQRRLRSSVKELKRINEDLEQFSRMASHDLQEPLRMITSFTELLEEDYAHKLDETGLDYIRLASGGARRMSEMLSGLMTYAKEGRREADPENVDLEALVADVLDEYALAIKEASVSLEVDLESKQVFADATGLRCILRNLVGNAIKYRRAESPKIMIRSASTAEFWQLSVTDNGIGIRHDFLETIFEPFRRLHTNEDYEGSGIGLSLCKRIASNWNARLEAKSRPKEGSTFTLVAPRLDQHYQRKAA